MFRATESDTATFLSVYPGNDFRLEPTNTYLEAHCAENELLNAGIIDYIRQGNFQVIDDPTRSVVSLLEAMERDFDAIYLSSSTCSWDETQAIELTKEIGRFVLPKGNIRLLQGKGCNVLIDAVALARETVLAGHFTRILVICVEKCNNSLNRLQGYAYFSDHCIGIEVSSRSGQFNIEAAQTFMASYDSTAFSNTCELAICPSEIKIGANDLTVLTLNCFDFFLRFKFGKAPLYDQHLAAEFDYHHFGIDPFISLVQAETEKPVLIHIESPPGHIGQLLLTRQEVI